MEQIALAEFLFRRLYQLGIRSIHGVPGDYNLLALDYVSKVGLLWVGNCNELNAGYAADGYARINGIAALVTKCGVGELSALNAIAGAYSEFVPVVHIVGTSSTVSQDRNASFQHTLSNGDHQIFEGIAKQFACATANLATSPNPTSAIDEVLKQCITQSKPVYIAMPVDLVELPVDRKILDAPIDIATKTMDKYEEDQALNRILEYLHDARQPAILADAGVLRRKAQNAVEALLQKSQIPTFVTPTGKSAVAELSPLFKGVYAGNGSSPSVLSYFENVDLLIHIGALTGDSTTAWYKSNPAPLGKIVKFPIEGHDVLIEGTVFKDIDLVPFLRKLAQRLDDLSFEKSKFFASDHFHNDTVVKHPPDGAITHDWLWPRMSSWLGPNEIVVTETGTANYGIRETRFPEKVQAICQPLWSSIGYATAACQGAGLAAKELGLGRTILFTGEGSFQVSGQELSTMIRHCLPVIVFIICNGGYTTERLIHGMEAAYNDVQPWKYEMMCHLYGGTDHTNSYRVETRGQLEQVLLNNGSTADESMKVIEIHMGQTDAPVGLRRAVSVMVDRG